MSRKIELTMKIKSAGYGRRVVAFNCTSSDGTFPKGEVSLARRPDHCFFTLDKLQDHGCLPPFNKDGSTPDYRPGGPSLDDYVERVKADVQMLITAALAEAAKYAPDGDISIGTWEYDA